MYTYVRVHEYAVENMCVYLNCSARKIREKVPISSKGAESGNIVPSDGEPINQLEFEIISLRFFIDYIGSMRRNCLLHESDLQVDVCSE